MMTVIIAWAVCQLVLLSIFCWICLHHRNQRIKYYNKVKNNAASTSALGIACHLASKPIYTSLDLVSFKINDFG